MAARCASAPAATARPLVALSACARSSDESDLNLTIARALPASASGGVGGGARSASAACPLNTNDIMSQGKTFIAGVYAPVTRSMLPSVRPTRPIAAGVKNGPQSLTSGPAPWVVNARQRAITRAISRILFE